MKSREWLVSQSLAKAGKGRLSFAAKAALAQALSDGMAFDDGATLNIEPTKTAQPDSRPVESNLEPIERPKTSQVTAPEPEPKVVVRKQKVAYGLSHGQFSDVLVAFSTCADCGRTVECCQHQTPRLPKWLNNTNEFELALLERP